MFNSKIEVLNYLKGFEYGENTFYDFTKEIIEDVKKFFKVDDNGFTKIVFIDREKKFVYKFPKSKKFDGFDYCKEEVTTANLAKKAMVDKFFAITEKVNDIYIQPFVDTIGEYPDCGEKIDSEEFWDIRNEVFKIIQFEVDEQKKEKGYSGIDFRFSSITWAIHAFKYYGEQDFKQLMHFLRVHKVNDLHESNVGFIGEKPVLVDYSGFGRHRDISYNSTESRSSFWRATTSIPVPYSRDNSWSF